MTVSELSEKMGLETLVPGDPTRRVTGGYTGDLLSWVMARANEGDAWITVMGSINSVAVAVLTEVACIILSEDSALDEDARVRAEKEGIAILRSSETAFRLAVELDRLLG
ncbi:MAG: hypothetical protein GX136_06960 [Clostridiales bacterium]|jgi:hypothetical protein|nr:hypothetical protein [Clostridiales bacterium]